MEKVLAQSEINALFAALADEDFKGMADRDVIEAREKKSKTEQTKFGITECKPCYYAGMIKILEEIINDQIKERNFWKERAETYRKIINRTREEFRDVIQ
jgi:hypothetical protein